MVSSFPHDTINSYGVMTLKSIPLLQVSLLSDRLVKHHHEQSWAMEREKNLDELKSVKSLDGAGLNHIHFLDVLQ